MTANNVPWTSMFRPKSLKDLVDNEKAINQLLRWANAWEKGVPKIRAAFLYGPPGIGKTSSVVALANDLNFDLLEVNASDFRTGKLLNALIGRSAGQSLTVFGRRRMILLDELEGVSGREDRGGIRAIVNLIKETRIPVVLVATSATERWEEKFSPLRQISLLIEYDPIPFKEVVRRLELIAREVDVSIDMEVLERIAELSRGDLRSAINDLEAIARGREHITSKDVESLSERDRQEYTPDALMRMFSAKTLKDARGILASAYIKYDDIFDWIYENLPLILDDPLDLAEGLDALARADIHKGRANRTQNFKLLKYMFNDMTGGVALSRRRSEGAGVVKQVRAMLMRLGFPHNLFDIRETPDGVLVKPLRYLGDDWKELNLSLRQLAGKWLRGEGGWILPYLRRPQLLWRRRRTWHRRRLQGSIANKIAKNCHISSREAISEVLPLLKEIFRGDKQMAVEIAAWLELDDRAAKWLIS